MSKKVKTLRKLCVKRLQAQDADLSARDALEICETRASRREYGFRGFSPGRAFESAKATFRKVPRNVWIGGAVAVGGYLLLRGGAVFKYPIAQPLRITSGFGPRSNAALGLTSGGNFHMGLDFGVPVGTNVLAAGDGVVTQSFDSPSYGRRIIITHGAIGGEIYQTTYNHLTVSDVKKGQRVSAGEPIGLSGGAKGNPLSGTSTGPHLHFEVKRFDGKGEIFYDPRAFLPGGGGPASASSWRPGGVMVQGGGIA